MKPKAKHLHLILRLCMGWIFLWPFLDKSFGLGFATERADAWISGGSPTAGYLEFATYGPLAPFFQALAGHALVDWLFMLGLLGVGLAFLSGKALRFAAYTGAFMLLLMWLSTLVPEHNPFLDEHIIYGLVMIALAETKFTFLKGELHS